MERSKPRQFYRFGLFELDPKAGELCRSGRRIPLQDLPFRLLHELLQKPGELVTREQLRQALWPQDVHVDFDGSLNAAVRRVRDALGDTAKDSRFLETLPRRGYRFLAPVSVQSDDDGDTGAGLLSTDQNATDKDVASDLPIASPETLGSGSEKPERVGGWLTLSVAIVGLLVWILTARFAPPPTLPKQPQRLAVLPLEAIGEDQRLAAIAAGLTDELIVHIGGLAPQHLRVVAPTSVRRAQADGDDLQAIARRLDVGFVLAGTLRIEGDRVRVAARLIRTESEALMWTTSLERRLGSLLDVQRELAARMSEGLRRELLGGAPLEVAAARADVNIDPQAYEAFLKARHFLALQTPESFASAERELLSALERAPAFADAWAALATTRSLIGIYDIERPRDVFPRAETALERALALDPKNADALVARAIINGTFYWRFDAAEATLRQVLEDSPQHLEARRWLGLRLQSQGYDQEAQAELAVARRLDPLSLTLLSTVSWCHFLAGRTDIAIENAKDILELDADYLVAWDDLKWFYTVQGRDAEAAEAFFKVVELEGNASAVPKLRRLYADQGFRGLLEESLANHLRKAARDGYHSPFDIAIAAAAVGRTDEALDWLERSFAEREVDLIGLKSDPRLDSLRAEERFTELLERFQRRPDAKA